MLTNCTMDDEDKEHSSISEEQSNISVEHMIDSGIVGENVPSCIDPAGGVLGESSDHTAVCKDAVTMEMIMEAENDQNRTLDCDRVHAGVEPVEQSNSPVGIHQQVEVCGDEGETEQQEATECVQGDTDSGNVDNLKKVQLANNLRLLTGSWKGFDKDNYFRGCKWAPDGTCLLSCSNDNIMRLYNLPTQLYSDPGSAQDLPEMSPALSVAQGEAVYDFCWYPRMNSWEPNTCCFVTSSKDHPVQLWDAFTTERRTAYVPHNDVDEVIAPHSLAFSLDGDKLYTGFNKFIKVFDTSRPGRYCTTIRTYERTKGGQPGIISCITMHPTLPGTFALGSYSCSIGLYCEGVSGALSLLTGLQNGVTQLLISPDGNVLYAGFRKYDKIQSWDLRNPGKVLYEMKREVCTNQRIFFDFYDNGHYIISGSSDGCVCGWSLGDGDSSLEPLTLLERCLEHKAHKDVVNGVSVHPSLPLLATCSGQRSFPMPSCGCGENGSSDSDTDQDNQQENSLKLWLLLDK